MSSSTLPIRSHHSSTNFIPQFCKPCLAFDDELSRIERLIDEPEPQAKSDSVPGPTQQLISLPPFPISNAQHIWDHAAACRCCRSLRDYLSRRSFSSVAANSPGAIHPLAVSVVFLPLFPESTVPRLWLKAGVDIIAKESISEHAPGVDAFYSTTPSSRDGLLVRAVGPRIDLAHLRRWIAECRVSHGSECSRSRLPNDWGLVGLETQHLEFYLIDVHRMCLAVSTMKDAPPYVALSYRWGDPVRSTQCCLANLATMKAPGGLVSEHVVLAPTIQDAITFTREVGFRYLWVDALCIVQDDYERKATYLSLMGTVYADAALVLAILEGNADMGIAGIGHDRDISDTITLPTRSLIKTTRRIAGKESFSDKTWATRGWTFQEGLFASKMLTIDTFASWHCPCANWMEEISRPPHSPYGPPPQVSSKQPGNPQVAPSTFLDFPRVPSYMSLAGYARLIHSYNTRSLTMDSDALNAVAGVTGRLHSLFPDGFIQGLPQFYLDVALLWQPRAPLRLRVDAPGAPALSSWSWAAWHGDLDLDAWSDSHIVYDEPLALRNNRIVDWQKLRCGKTRSGDNREEWLPVQFTFHAPRGRFEDPAVTEMPPPHRFFTYNPPDRKTHMPNIPFRFPFPPFERLRNVDREPSHVHLLRAKLQVALLTLSTLSLPPRTSASSVEDAPLVNAAGEPVGWLRLNLYEEARPAHGTGCEVVAISEGVVVGGGSRNSNRNPSRSRSRNRKPALEVDTDTDADAQEAEANANAKAEAKAKDKDGACFYHVLWIERKGDVAYRRALGQVGKAAWERECAGEIEIVLG